MISPIPTSRSNSVLRLGTAALVLLLSAGALLTAISCKRPDHTNEDTGGTAQAKPPDANHPVVTAQAKPPDEETGETAQAKPADANHGEKTGALAAKRDDQPAVGILVQRLTLEPDVDRRGQDYRNFDLQEARPELCESECVRDGECKAFTYVKPGQQGPSARCWLKSAVPLPVSDACCVSGVRGR